MNTSPPSTCDLDRLFDIVTRTWNGQPDYLEDLKLNFDLAIDHFTALNHAHPSDKRIQELALHLTQALLFDYYLGCVLFKFSPTYAPDVPIDTLKTTKQQNTERRLQRLAQFEICRRTMATYFVAALEKRLHPLLRKYVKFGPTTLYQLLFQSLLPLLSADDWEKLSEYGITFGLNGFFLLYRTMPDKLPPDEFDLLCKYIHRLAQENRWPACTDVVHILTIADLSPQQQSQLLELVQSILDSARFPFKEYEENVNGRIDASHLNPILTRLVKWSVSKTGKQVQEWKELNIKYRSVREQNSFIWRQEQVARMLTELSSQNYNALQVLQEITLQALKHYREKFPNRFVAQRNEFLDTSLECILLVAVTNVQALETFRTCLAVNGQTTLSDAQIVALKKSKARLTEEVAESLLSIIYAEEDSCRWAEQILENVPRYEYEATQVLADAVSTEPTPRILRTLTRLLHQTSSENNGQYQHSFHSALVNHLLMLLFDRSVPLEDHWFAFLCNIANREPLRRILDHCTELLNLEENVLTQKRILDVLRMIGEAAYQISSPDAATLAACWLVAATSRTQDPQSLVMQVEEANDLISYRVNAVKAERVIEILDSVALHDEYSHDVIARSLRYFTYPDLAVPLLEKLMDMAILYENTYVFKEAFKSLVSLSPLTPRTLQALQARLTLAYDIDYPLLLTPKIVYDEILPLVPDEIESSCVDLLIDMIWRCHCPSCGATSPNLLVEKSALGLRVEELRHRYLHPEPEIQEVEESLLLFALQALTKVSTLSPIQQQVIGRLWRTSWHAPIKARALFILSRQRSREKKTMDLLLHVLKTNPLLDCYTCLAKDLLRQLLFQWFSSGSPSRAHWGAIFMCQSVAVFSLIGSIKEINEMTIYNKWIIKTIHRLLSPVRCIIEEQLARVTSNGSEYTDSALGWMLGPAQTEINHERQIWFSRPSDVAYQALYNLLSQKRVS